MINNHDNKIAILTFKDDTEYYCDIRDNHVMYCKKNNYDKHEMLENIIENHEFFMLVDKKCLFLNQNILIEDLINSDLKYYYLENNNKYEVIIFRKNNESSKILKDIIKSKKMKDIVQHEKHIHYFDENQLYCYYNNYTPDKYILSIENIHQSINIRKQIQLFNNLIKHEDKNPKIIISVTTIPTRIKGLKKLVENLSSSTIKPDKIVFTITNKYKLFGESTEHIENINTLFKSEIKAGLVYINLIDIDKEEYNDYGPCNKWIGAYEYIKKEEFVDEFENDNYVVIVLDDDVIYHNNFIELLINKYNLNKRSIVTGYHSYSNYSIKNNYQMNVCIYKEHKKIPLLKGVNGTLLPKHLFCNNLNPLLKDVVDNGIKFFGKNDLVYQDDQIITTTLYYYRYNIVSVYDDLLSIGKKKSYTNNKINDDKKIDWHGVSYTNISKKSWYDRGLTEKFLHKFLKFYVYK
jgi:hypothetical protein